MRKKGFMMTSSQHLDQNLVPRNSNIQNLAGDSSETRKASPKRVFLLAIIVMLVCGSSNDFLGKLIYQIIPGDDSGLPGLEVDYWATWCLTAGSFFICSFALIGGRKSFTLLNKKLFLKICIPAFMDLFVTGGRYLSLVFLPAAVISILKNGFQLLFLALFRRFYRKKHLTNLQWIGLSVTIIGLIIVSLEDILSKLASNDPEQLQRTIIGTVLLIIIGFLGSIRNTMEEILLQLPNGKALDSDFLVGMESIISLFFMVIFGIILLFTDPFGEDEDYDDIGEAARYIAGFPAVIVCFILFIFAIFGKDTMQMKVAKLTSSLTRKLFQQLYPIGTWILSLITYCINSLYGEPWDKYSFIRLLGFIVILIGTYLYVKPPKIKRKLSIQETWDYNIKHIIAVTKNSPRYGPGIPNILSNSSNTSLHSIESLYQCPAPDSKQPDITVFNFDTKE